MSTNVIAPASARAIGERLMVLALSAAAAVATLRGALFTRVEKIRRRDGGYTAVELILITAAVIVVVGIVVVAIKTAVTTKSGDVSKCITGADTTNNGGCN
ncbi:hypothetical protein [Kitasatospora sp. NPDC127060]|uniref:hypothetical protein n=1 Tax=Kitasatospora sp. NPDC127060 TaxID=3347121 RepID=UPI003663FC2C